MGVDNIKSSEITISDCWDPPCSRFIKLKQGDFKRLVLTESELIE